MKLKHFVRAEGEVLYQLQYCVCYILLLDMLELSGIMLHIAYFSKEVYTYTFTLRVYIRVGFSIDSAIWL